MKVNDHEFIEYAIGETFVLNGKTYETIRATGCDKCDLICGTPLCDSCNCKAVTRSDNMDVVFKCIESKTQPPAPANDPVNHPTHYTSHPSGVECITVARHHCFSIGNAIKYLWRAGLKKEAGMTDRDKEIQDLKKAIWYIQDRINELDPSF